MKQTIFVTASAALLFLALALFPTSVAAQSTTEAEMNALVSHLTRTQPNITKLYDDEKKKFEKWEKDLEKTADSYTQFHMDAVFGKDKLKSSDVLLMLKVSEAVMAGDFQYAGKALSDSVMKCPPKLGCYLLALKAVETPVALQINRWEKEIYQTQSFKYFRYDLAHLTTFEEMIKGRSDYRDFQAYIPSYMVQPFRNNPNIGNEMSALYIQMVAREQIIKNTWLGQAGSRLISVTPEEKKFNAAMTRSDAFGVLLWGEPWLEGHQNRPWWQFGSTGDNTAKWRSRLGFAPGDKNTDAEQAIFNHFLYTVTEPKREDYMMNLVTYYIEPLIEKEARKQARETDEAIAEVLQKSMTNMGNASRQAAFKAREAEYRKYLDDGLANGTIFLPASIKPDTAHVMGMQAVAGKKSYQDLITSLHARAVKERAALAAEAAARQAKSDALDQAFVTQGGEVSNSDEVIGNNVPADLPPVEEEEVVPADTASDPIVLVEPVIVRAPRVGVTRRNCLMAYDFSQHKNADMLALLPDYLQSDARGHLSAKDSTAEEFDFLLSLASDICRPGGTELPIVAVPEEIKPEPAPDEEDEWGDVNDVDDIIVSDLSEQEKWAKRDAYAAKSDQDAARSEDRFNRQYASAEARRQEEARIAREKAAKRAEAMAALSQGLTAIASQIQESDRQSAADAHRNAQAYDTSSLQKQAQERASFINSCVQGKYTPGFPSMDPAGDRYMCGQEFSARKNGTYTDDDSYAEKLKRQQQQTAQRYADEQSQRSRSGNDSARAVRERVLAKKQCGCYRDGKRLGAQLGEDFTNGIPSDQRPEHCVAMHGMGNTPPWRMGVFDGKRNETDKTVAHMCRFGT